MYSILLLMSSYYCNVNGNHPNMGSAIHMDTNLVDIDPQSKKYIQINATLGVWCRTKTYGFNGIKRKTI